MPAAIDRPLSEMVDAHILCAMSSSTDDNDNPLYENYDEDDDVTPEARAILTDDCRRFIQSLPPLVFALVDANEMWDQAGHDFWLTRNGHGAGFWDGDWDSIDPGIGEWLTQHSKSFGKRDLYIGDDGRVHIR